MIPSPHTPPGMGSWVGMAHTCWKIRPKLLDPVCLAVRIGQYHRSCIALCVMRGAGLYVGSCGKGARRRTWLPTQYNTLMPSDHNASIPRSLRAKGRVTIRLCYRTARQWERCLSVGKLLGMAADDVLAKTLRITLVRMQEECDRRGIDWRSAMAPADRELKIDPDAALDERKPRIDM